MHLRRACQHADDCFAHHVCKDMHWVRGCVATDQNKAPLSANRANCSGSRRSDLKKPAHRTEVNPKSMSGTSRNPESRTRVHVHTGAPLSSTGHVHLQLSGSFNEEISHLCPSQKRDKFLMGHRRTTHPGFTHARPEEVTYLPPQTLNQICAETFRGSF